MYEFDLKTLWDVIKSKRKMLLRNCIIGGVVAVVIGFSIPKSYQTDIMLAAELQDESALGGSAASLASLAGISLGGGTDAIGPNLYPNVVSSNKFIVELLESQVTTTDSVFTGTYKEYLQTQEKSPWWNYPMIWLKKGIKSLKEMVSSQPAKKGGKGMNPENLSIEEDGLVVRVRGTVICSVNDDDGTISISARSQDPYVAKALVDRATKQLQDFITLYRTNKARVDLKYYQGLEKDAMKSYQEAQRAYADFNDSHRDISLQSYINERESLQNDLQLAFTAYSQMKQQVLMAVAKVQENTPAFTVIEAATVPPMPDSPRKKLILFAVLFLTALGTLGWIYVKLLFFTPKEKQVQKTAAEA